MWRRLVQFIGSLYCQYYLQGCQANSADRKIVCFFKQWVHFILSYFLVLRNWEKMNHKTRYSRQWSCLSAKLKLNRFARSKWLHTHKGPLVIFFSNIWYNNYDVQANSTYSSRTSCEVDWNIMTKNFNVRIQKVWLASVTLSAISSK